MTQGQLALEYAHLLAKLAARDPGRHALLSAPASAAETVPAAHPLFTVVPGPAADWERA